MADRLGLKMGTCPFFEGDMHSGSLTGDLQLREQKPEASAMKKNPLSKDANTRWRVNFHGSHRDVPSPSGAFLLYC